MTTQDKRDGNKDKEIDTRKKLHHLDGKTWLRYSISVWDDLVKNSEERGIKHPAMFPTSLTDRLIKTFYPGRKGLILDPFLGSGSTLCSAYSLGIPGVGFEIVPEFIKLAKERLEQIPGDPDAYPQIIPQDARRMKEHLTRESVGLCITSPPYWDILRRRRSADGKSPRYYGEDSADLGNIRDYREFLTSLTAVFRKVYQVLTPAGYCVVIVMDIRKGPQFFPLHMDLTVVMRELGFILDDIIIWDRKQEYNHLRPLGYPHVFRVNKVHEFIMIYQRP